jgi:DNA-binding transcriptional LysR family regulator
MKHNCITLRLASSGGLYAWELRHDGQDMECGCAASCLQRRLPDPACGAERLRPGLLPEDLAGAHVHAGRLLSVMEDWCPSFPGLHAYYPSRRQNSRALALVIDAIRYNPSYKAVLFSPDGLPSEMIDHACEGEHHG